ncbi:hypothetical protein [Puniceibacterium sp. IMCC21224]|uniref:hypothetical protein n=1 Tax=Puniceibacterium sp. IMCC21224 TaxID=1618204 RepID=UPI001E3803AF|nr:hypothetical protein [Puniceibacterium sp. IMCC21224]
MRLLCKMAAFLALVVLISCGGVPTDEPTDAIKIAELAHEIAALGPKVDPEEARRAARIAVSYPRQLAISYQITDSPIVHNAKVNRGARPRGLCWHWAEDLEKRLAQEGFVTLDLHRAIANYRTAFRIEHSTVIVSRRGGRMESGLVLDPWRWGGTLYWGPVRNDTAYPWRPQREVLADKRRRHAGSRAVKSH